MVFAHDPRGYAGDFAPERHHTTHHRDGGDPLSFDDLIAAPADGSILVAQSIGSGRYAYREYAISVPGAAGLMNVLGVANGETEPTWKAAEHSLLSVRHSDSIAAAVSRGSMIVGNATPAWAEVVIGASGRVWHSDGADPSWQALVSADLPFVNHMFAARKGAAAQSVNSATVTVLTFDTEDFDPNNNFTSNAYTAPATGKYQFNTSTVVATGTVLSTLYALGIYVNGAQSLRILETQEAAVAGYKTFALSCLLSLTVADVVDVRVSQNSGGALNFNGAAAATDQFFNGFRVS